MIILCDLHTPSPDPCHSIPCVTLLVSNLLAAPQCPRIRSSTHPQVCIRLEKSAAALLPLTGRTRLVRLVGLVEEEVGRELLVLVAGEVGLDDHVALEAETA